MTSSHINLRSNALKRILKDIKENQENPVNGISICIPNEDDIFTLHGNIKIMNGIYKDILLHVIIHLPDDYPLTGPAMNVAPGIGFDHQFHEHVYNDSTHGNSICNDLLTNFSLFFASQKKVASGWSPGYTLNTIFMQMGLFFEEPDLPQKMIPSTNQISKLILELQKFKCNVCGHTTLNPYPPIIADIQATISKKDSDHEALLQKVTCSISKMNIETDKNLILGCPLNVNIDRFGRIWAFPILETISYDTYIGEIQKAGIAKLDSYSKHYFTSALGQQYNFWIPFYLSKEHFERGFQTIINAISVIKHGSAKGISNYDFKPEYALDVLLSLCNKTVVNILDNKLHESKAAIEGYVQFIRLLMEFIERYPVLQHKIDTTIRNFMDGRSFRHKSSVPDIGEFIITLFLSKYKYEDVKDQLLEEYFTRQIFWMQKKEVNFNINNASELLTNCFEASKVSCQLLTFNLQMGKTFIFEGVKNKLDANYGFPPEHIVTSFQDTIKNIKNQIINYPQFLKSVNYQDKIKTPQDMVNFLKNARKLSVSQEYTKNY